CRLARLPIGHELPARRLRDCRALCDRRRIAPGTGARAANVPGWPPPRELPSADGPERGAGRPPDRGGPRARRLGDGTGGGRPARREITVGGRAEREAEVVQALGERRETEVAVDAARRAPGGKSIDQDRPTRIATDSLD